MYNNFKEYKAYRESLQFDSSFNALCEMIAESNIPFNVYWETHALPLLLDSDQFSNSDDLLQQFANSELLLEFFNGSINPMKWGRNGKNINQANNMNNASSWADQQDASDASATTPAAPSAKEKRLNQFNQQADQMTNNIKQRFAVAMRDFLKAVTDDAKAQNNPHMWQIAKTFYQKIMSSAQPVIDKFKMVGQTGKPKAGYRSEFDSQRGAMQNQRTNDMKQKLQNPAVQAGIDQMRQTKGGWGNADLAQWAKEFAGQRGFRPEQLIGPNGKPTQLGMQYLPNRNEWQPASGTVSPYDDMDDLSDRKPSMPRPSMQPKPNAI